MAPAPSRPRRTHGLWGAGVVFAIALVVTGVLGARGFGGGDETGGSPTVRLGIPLAPQAAATVELQNDARTAVGHAGARGTVTFDTKLTPGTYDVVVTVDGATDRTPPDGVEIGAARVVYHERNVAIENGANTLDLHTAP